MAMYFKETREALKQGLARKDKRPIKKRGKMVEVDHIVYDFEFVLQKVITSMGIKQPDYVDDQRLKKYLEKIVKSAKKNSLIERIALGEPFLEFSVS